MSTLDRPTIVIADDDEQIRRFLTKVCHDYSVIEASNGLELIELAESMEVDLFMVDIHMPEMDGFETCERLRADERWSSTPLIFMTSDACPTTIERAFEAGATDYLRKPFVLTEVRSRVNIQLDFQAQIKRNKSYGAQMEKLASERAKQLMHADRLVTLGTLASGIAHEINNPNTFIRGNAEMLRTAMDSIVPALEHACQNNIGNTSKARFLLDEYTTMIDDILEGTDRITAIVKGVKQFAHKSNGYINTIDVNRCVHESLALVQHKIKNKVSVELDLNETPVNILGDSQQIDQVLTNLFVNASDAMQKKQEKRLAIRTSLDQSGAQIVVEDTGTGMPQSLIKKIFDPFFTTKEVGKGTGLGLSLTMRIVEDHGGEIDVQSRPGKGTTFTMRFPPVDSSEGASEANESDTLRAAA